MARILIVEDSPTEQTAMQHLLSQHGHQVWVANDGHAALDMARQHKPDLIFMDVVMPGLNGYQATRELKKDASTANIPVVMITSKTQDSDKYWGMRQGAKAYICKPASEQEILDVVSSLI
ncbi:MAG: response regulator [Pseudomonadales bacterium]|nr:response regulator [Pseudomonadales bacterium]